MWNRVYASAWCPSVRLSICLTNLAAVAWPAGDIDPLLHGTLQRSSMWQANAASAMLSVYIVTEHRFNPFLLFNEHWCLSSNVTYTDNKIYHFLTFRQQCTSGSDKIGKDCESEDWSNNSLHSCTGKTCIQLIHDGKTSVIKNTTHFHRSQIKQQHL